jgi:hypothetical protein
MSALRTSDGELASAARMGAFQLAFYAVDNIGGKIQDLYWGAAARGGQNAACQKQRSRGFRRGFAERVANVAAVRKPGADSKSSRANREFGWVGVRFVFADVARLKVVPKIASRTRINLLSRATMSSADSVSCSTPGQADSRIAIARSLGGRT